MVAMPSLACEESLRTVYSPRLSNVMIDLMADASASQGAAVSIRTFAVASDELVACEMMEKKRYFSMLIHSNLDEGHGDFGPIDEVYSPTRQQASSRPLQHQPRQHRSEFGSARRVG